MTPFHDFQPTFRATQSLTMRLVFALAAFVAVASTASAQYGIGAYDLKSSADRALAFDYNSNGNLDHIVLYRPGSGVVFIEEKQNGVYVPIFTSFAGIGGYDLRSPDDRIIAFDYKGTGHADHLLCYRPGTGTVWILENSNGMFYPVYSSATGIGDYDLRSTADRIITFDYDGSGKYDHLVLYRPGTGSVFIVKNDGGEFSPVFNSDSGIGGYDLKSPNDRLIAFDYYSIGIGDHLLAYRPGNGIAYVLENVNGSGNFAAVQSSTNGIGGYDLKLTTDRLVAFDYAKTGNQDHLIAYRPGNSVVYILESSYLSYSPIFSSTSGLGDFDLKSTADRIFTFDYSDSGFLDTVALYRPGASAFFIETNANGEFTYHTP